MKQHDMNVARMKAVIKQLRSVADEVVFVGGATIGFLISDPAAAEVRPTRDVDVIADIATRAEYAANETKLRALGLQHNIKGATCSFKFEDPDLGEILIDFMPIDENVLQLKNYWYKAAFRNAVSVNLEAGIYARIISAPYFLATKLEAFADRGGGDYLLSKDLSDIILVLDGRPELFDEIQGAEPELLDFLRKSFKLFLGNETFKNSIEAHLEYGTSVERADMVLEIMKRITG